MRKLMLIAAIAVVGLPAMAMAEGASTTPASPALRSDAASTGSETTPSKGYSADDLLGSDIVDPNGRTIGQVADLLVQPDGGIQSVLIDVGNFLGIGYRTVAIDLDQLQRESDGGKTFMVRMTSDELKTLPAYKKTDQGWRPEIG
jgi:sporulation protein YlmC with PRC-barrel domain